MSEEKLNALSQVPILRDERFNIGYIAKWCGEDVASDEINCNQDHDQLMKNGHSDCWTCGKSFDKQINWQAKYERLNLSLAKNKRLFSDEYSQSVIESQVKRIKRLEDDLSRANCELDKLRNKNPASVS